MGYTRQQTERYIERECLGYGFTYAISNDVIFINTGIGHWMITIDQEGKVLRLDHEHHLISSGRKYKKSYHQQAWRSRSLSNTFFYIRNHDRSFAKAKNDDTSIDDLFASIESERASKYRR